MSVLGFSRESAAWSRVTPNLSRSPFNSPLWVDNLVGFGPIALFGADAKRAIPALQACLENKNEGLKAAAQQAIKTIESAQPEEAARSAHAEALQQI